MKEFNTIIETERLILRPFTLDDIDPSYQINLDPEVSKFTADGGVIDLAEMKKRIEGVVEGDYIKYGFGRFAVECKTTRQFIGFAGLKFLPEYDFADLGYRFARNFWGKGIATEAGKASLDFAFRTLKLPKVYAFAISENVASIRVLEKLGFAFDKNVTDEGVDFQQFVINLEEY